MAHRSKYRRSLAALAIVVATALADPAAVRGEEPQATPATCPPIPSSFDLDMTPAEWQVVERGEIDVRVIKTEDGQRFVRAVGYLDGDPVSLFDLATDSELAAELVDVIKEVEIIDQGPTRKLLRGSAKVSFFLPSFEYTLAANYLKSRTGQCWWQVEGDFRKNEGSHSFLWDAERGQTLAVFTFEFALKGLLRVVPEWLVLRLSGRTLPGFMRRLEELAPEVAAQSPARAAENAARWQELRSRLERGEMPERRWRRTPRQAAFEQAPR